MKGIVLAGGTGLRLHPLTTVTNDKHLLLHALAQQTGKPEEDYTKLITFVPDRPGHDRRYALDSWKLHAQLGWVASTPVRQSLERSIASLV